MMLLASEMLCEGSAVSTLKAQQKSAAETASSSVGLAHVGAQLGADCDTDEQPVASLIRFQCHRNDFARTGIMT